MMPLGDRGLLEASDAVRDSPGPYASMSPEIAVAEGSLSCGPLELRRWARSTSPSPYP
jgi:hypothetical protein